MHLKHTLSPAFTTLPLQGWGRRGRGFGKACHWILPLVCIFFTLWRGDPVRAQERSGGLPQSPSIEQQSAQPDAEKKSLDTNADADLDQARLAVKAGAFPNAEAIVGKYLSQHNASADGHYLQGYILSHERKAKESLAEYTRAAQLRTPTADDLKVVAVDYVLLGDFADADRWLTKALAWNPADAEGWYYLGRTKYNENRFAEAVDDFQRCLKLDPHNVKAEDNLGLSYEGLNQIEQATQTFQTAIAWQTDGSEKNAQPYLNLGTLIADQGDPNAALGYLQQAVALAPQNAKAHEQLGRAYLKLKRLKDAQGELEKAVLLAPNSSSLHYELGISYRDQGLKDQARKEFDRCTRLNADHSSVDAPNE